VDDRTPQTLPMEVNQTLAFVDLETTGATAGADRITEIGIVEVGGGGVREWSALVNPGQRIPEFIERLTGISNAAVAHAPCFGNLAGEVLERLQGRLFIAHNARFDYGFLKDELKRAGHDFRATVLCTVKLSRKLYPQYSKHSLDSLIERHGLDVTDRHRALGDARLIWQFWQKLHRDHPAALIDAAVKLQTARPSLPPHFDQGLIDELPDGHGVYLFYGEDDLPLYIGKSRQLKKSILSHFAPDKNLSLSRQVRRIEWLETAGELGAILKESTLVNKLRPTHNRRRRPDSESLVDWPYAGPLGVREGGDLHVVDAWCYFGTARSEEETWTLLAGGRPVFDPDHYRILRKRLPRERVVLLRNC